MKNPKSLGFLFPILAIILFRDKGCLLLWSNRAIIRDMSKKRYRIYAMGCKVNAYDAEKLGKELAERGFQPSEEGVDLAVLFSCTVTRAAVAKNRLRLRKIRQDNPGAKIVLAGCWPRVEILAASSLGVDLVLDNDDRRALWRLLDSLPALHSEKKEAQAKKRARYFIKIQDGCEQFCSYCIIPYARGPLQSRGREEVLTEIRGALDAGYQEIILSGIHLGLYGHQSQYRLYDLLVELLAWPGDFRIRLSSIEVREVESRIIALLANNRKLCRHLHIPLQSGTDSILRAMNRPYDTEFFRQKIAEIRAAVPEVAITTDVIVGFPGETEKEALATERFVRELGFSQLHVFPFSAHAKTPAFVLPDKLSSLEIKKRAERLRALSKIMEQEYQQSFRGQELSVIVENLKKGRAKLKTEYYFDIDCPIKEFREEQVGQLISLKF